MSEKDTTMAYEWFAKGTEAISSMDAFSNFWRGFNNLYSGGAGNERDKIKSFLRQNLDQAAAHELLTLYTTQIDYLLLRPVIDMRNNGRTTKTNIDEFKEATNSLTKLEELFMIIYQVRCNLEHGQKSPTDNHDIKLCECAAPILGAVVKHSL